MRVASDTFVRGGRSAVDHVFILKSPLFSGESNHVCIRWRM